MRRAQGELAAPAAGRLPLALKCSVHQGSCLAINQNDRLDYFGMTVNVAARLCALSTGDDIVVSAPVRHDPDVAALLAGAPGVLTERPDSAVLRGLGGEAYDFWRLKG
jgi:class 3 adenylate cyclase